MKYIKVKAHYRHHHLTGRRHLVMAHHRKHCYNEHEEHRRNVWTHMKKGMHGKIM